MFKVGDAVRYKRSEPLYKTYPNVVFVITEVTHDKYRIVNIKKGINTSRFKFRLELATPKRSHFPDWF